MRIIIGTCALAALLLCGLLVWPTMWRYDRIGFGSNSLPVRENRLTGRTEMLTRSGWAPLERSSHATPKDLVPLPKSELMKVDMARSLSTLRRASSLEGEIYNGNEFDVYDLVAFAVHIREHPIEPPGAGGTITVGDHEVTRVTYDAETRTWIEALEVRRIAICQHLSPLATTRVFVNTGWRDAPGYGVMTAPASAKKSEHR